MLTLANETLYKDNTARPVVEYRGLGAKERKAFGRAFLSFMKSAPFSNPVSQGSREGRNTTDGDLSCQEPSTQERESDSDCD